MPFIIPIFINHRGCKNRCIFCNEKIVGSEEETPISEEGIARLVNSYLTYRKKEKEAEIAIYGGNFTGLTPVLQERILRLLKPYVQGGIVTGIRISTRPDEIDEERAETLSKYMVTTVELGAQSLNDEILERAGRGHTAADVVRASNLLKKKGFTVGLHLMMGLPGDRWETFRDTVEKVININPHMVRLHPTVVLRDTVLADLYKKGIYQPLSLEEAICWAKEAVKMFRKANIKVIRLGLQATEILLRPGNIVAGPYHPAFGALVESRILREDAFDLLKNRPVHGAVVTFEVPPKKESSFRGQKNENLNYLMETFNLAGIKLVLGQEDHISVLDPANR